MDPSDGSPNRWPMPSRRRPIVMIGAGGIVRDAHLPAYVKYGFELRGIYDIVGDRAGEMAHRFGIARVYQTIEEALSDTECVFDIAVPPDALLQVLEHVPDKSIALLQKPMGRDFAEARRIAALCHDKQLIAAVNFQFRFSALALALGRLIRRGTLGDLVDVDVHLNYREPWELFPFLAAQKRVDLQIASIHYFDWIRSVLGEPRGVYARSIPHPDYPAIDTVRTSAILDYGSAIRCCLSLNNTWKYGPQHEACSIRVEGRSGAAVATLGSLIGYPQGQPDRLQYSTDRGVWAEIPIEGSWFPDAFQGTMANLQRFAAGEESCLHTNVDDALRTMALIEALYLSSERGSTPLPS